MRSVSASSSWCGPPSRKDYPPQSIPLHQPTFSICNRSRAPDHGGDVVASSTPLVLPCILPANAQGHGLPQARTVSNRLAASTLHPQGEWLEYRPPHTVYRGGIWIKMGRPSFAFSGLTYHTYMGALSTDGKLTSWSPWGNLPERGQGVNRQVKGDAIISMRPHFAAS